MCHIRGTSLFPVVRPAISVTALPFLGGGYCRFSPFQGIRAILFQKFYLEDVDKGTGVERSGT